MSECVDGDDDDGEGTSVCVRYSHGQGNQEVGCHFSNVVIGDSVKQGQNGKYAHQVCVCARAHACMHAQCARGGQRAVISCQPNCAVPPPA